MRYAYAPGSAAADEALMRAQDSQTPAPVPPYTVLRRSQSYDLSTPGTPAGILDVAKAAAKGGRWIAEARFALALDDDGAPVASLALRLIEMPRPLKSAHSCRRCARWLEGEWSGADAAGRAELQRQMDAGRCDSCARREALTDGRRAYVVYARRATPDGASKWQPQMPHAAAILDRDAAAEGGPLVRHLGVIELKCILQGVQYAPPPPRPGPPRLRCFTCDRVTPFSVSTWRPYSRHRCDTSAEGAR